MKSKASKKRIFRWILLMLFFGAIFVLYFHAYFGGLKKVEPIDTKEFATYAGNVSDITIPDSVRIIALGEATHGNAEFQQLKLDVFKLMVARSTVCGRLRWRATMVAARRSTVTSTAARARRRRRLQL